MNFFKSHFYAFKRYYNIHTKLCKVVPNSFRELNKAITINFTQHLQSHTWYFTPIRKRSISFSISFIHHWVSYFFVGSTLYTPTYQSNPPFFNQSVHLYHQECLKIKINFTIFHVRLIHFVWKRLIFLSTWRIRYTKCKIGFVFIIISLCFLFQLH